MNGGRFPLRWFARMQSSGKYRRSYPPMFIRCTFEVTEWSAPALQIYSRIEQTQSTEPDQFVPIATGDDFSTLATGNWTESCSAKIHQFRFTAQSSKPHGANIENGGLILSVESMSHRQGCEFRVGEVGDLACQIGSIDSEVLDFPSKNGRVMEMNNWSNRDIFLRDRFRARDGRTAVT